MLSLLYDPTSLDRAIRRIMGDYPGPVRQLMALYDLPAEDAVWKRIDEWLRRAVDDDPDASSDEFLGTLCMLSSAVGWTFQPLPLVAVERATKVLDGIELDRDMLAVVFYSEC